MTHLLPRLLRRQVAIARGSVHLAEIGTHDLAGSLEISPLSGIWKLRNSDSLAAVEAGEGGINQFIHFHDARNLIHILAGVFPDLRPHRGRQHCLNVYALGPQLSVKTLA